MNDTGFTPTLSQVRQAWAYFQSESRTYTGSPGAEFNRWLDSVKADVWDKGHEAYGRVENPYRTDNQ